MTRVLLAGGGTAGHVNPLLATASELLATEPGIEITVLGTREGLEAQLVEQAGLDIEYIARVPFPRRPNLEALRFPGRLAATVKRVSRILRERKIDVVVGFGGYVSTPAYLAARRAGIAVVIHEQNARPGLANKLGARFADVVALTFAVTPLEARRGRSVLTGLPLRPEIARLATDGEHRGAVRERAGRELGLDPARPTLLVTGGSLGAVNVNQAVCGALEPLLATGAQVLHLAGKGKAAPLLEAAGASDAVISDSGVYSVGDYHVMEYLGQMHYAYALADLVVCRAGAGTVAEVCALGLPGVFVPLAVGNGEQRLNVESARAAGGAIVISDGEFTHQWVADNVAPLLSDRAALARIGEAAAKTSPGDGARELAKLVRKSAGKAG